MAVLTMNSGGVDLSEVQIVDNHCHGLEIDQILASDPASFEARLTITGQAFLTSHPHRRDPNAWGLISSLVEGNIFSMVSRRWLAEYLHCSEEELLATRDDRMRSGPVAYTRQLLDDQHIVELVADEGFTYQPVGAGELEKIVDVPVHRVARIESFIDSLITSDQCATVDDFADALENELEKAAADPATIALKSIIAYRTGLDIGAPDPERARAGFREWRSAGWKDSRETSKPVRDFLLHRAMVVVARHDIALHIHCGDGDADVVFQRSRPQDLFAFLQHYNRNSIVLMHAGHPWSEEAAYLASVLPHVYIDLSVLIPWASTNITRYLHQFLGMMPSRKLLYSSDQVYEPELFWLPARFARRALEQTLTDLVDGQYFSQKQALAVGEGILGQNCRRVHGFAR